MQRKRASRRRSPAGGRVAAGIFGVVIVVSLVVMSAQSLLPKAPATPTATRGRTQRSAIQLATARTPRPKSGTPLTADLLATLISKVTPNATPVPGNAAPPAEPATATPPRPAPAPVVLLSLAGGYPPADIRSGPGMSFDIIGTLQPGQNLRVTGRAPGDTWWRVVSDDQAGWLPDRGVALTGTLAALPVVNIDNPQ